ncbi:succinylglutamate desuccinylase/aspartoacylase family protein [uncultured Ruminococcus sp.]|uniref:M14 family metallopeptidase n=1 Tax=uncultured Ruminococcus sp. TaxID=165186 RepID=UPI00164A5034|nr:succinylglutamate desuccinylase/aspartoacylase family protein [uncultured Ruminococcus sp.]MBQ2441715.1 succinylglutamate desuccinylase/aspartoacylase family protein [Ruminococcus sp.]MBQ5763901.1 succinylglutamate desuccinylase/aspartoacylase family protein [Ruminococcus sp.]
MIETVASVGLPIDEKLMIQKNRLVPVNGLSGNEKRISIVTGTHGDELEGQYVCYELQRRIKENIECLTGIVDVYPAINPLGIDSITRGIPGFDLDMNRIFPGLENGSMPEYIASKIIDDLSGSAAVVDIHASNIFLEEIPQVRINELSRDTLVPLAKHLNVDYIWVHSSATVLESTLAYSLNVIGTPTLVVEMGVGMRITKKYGDQLTDGILALMKELGIWNGDVITPKEPIISEDGEVSFINAGKSGVFVPCVGHWKNVKKDGHIGDILNPLTGEINERILAPTDGIVFTLREYPIVNEGSLIARILA